MFPAMILWSGLQYRPGACLVGERRMPNRANGQAFR
jgi:hypothetical protein